MNENELVSFFRRTLADGTRRVRRWGGDDGAHVTLTAAEQVSVLDLLIEDVHFTRAFCPMHDIGYKAVAVNLSDLAACGAEPAYVMLGLAAERTFPETGMREFYRGFKACLDAYGADFAGGDFSRSDKLVVSVAAVGELPPGVPFWGRDGARAGDHVYVSGTLGLGLLGLEILRGNEPPYPDAVERYRRPEPALAVARYLAMKSVPVGACTDVSDGLSSELSHLAAESGALFVVDLDAVPRPDVARGLEMALAGGDDYELVFTSPAVIDPVHFLARTGRPLSRIGRVEAGRGVVTTDGTPLAARGYDHFADEGSAP